LAREEEWKRQEELNDIEAANWAVEARDGWGNTPPTSPVQEGWPGVPADATWPSLSDAVRPGGWPDLSLPSPGGVLVTTTTTIGEGEEHSAVMFHKCLTPKSVTIRSYKQQK
jgi:hypothetical protein